MALVTVQFEAIVTLGTLSLTIAVVFAGSTVIRAGCKQSHSISYEDSANRLWLCKQLYGPIGLWLYKQLYRPIGLWLYKQLYGPIGWLYKLLYRPIGLWLYEQSYRPLLYGCCAARRDGTILVKTLHFYPFKCYSYIAVETTNLPATPQGSKLRMKFLLFHMSPGNQRFICYTSTINVHQKPI